MENLIENIDIFLRNSLRDIKTNLGTRESCVNSAYSKSGSFSEEKCFFLVSQKDGNLVGICREDDKLYDWYEKSYNFIPYAFRKFY